MYATSSSIGAALLIKRFSSIKSALGPRRLPPPEERPRLPNPPREPPKLGRLPKLGRSLARYPPPIAVTGRRIEEELLLGEEAGRRENEELALARGERDVVINCVISLIYCVILTRSQKHNDM